MRLLIAQQVCLACGEFSRKWSVSYVNSVEVVLNLQAPFAEVISLSCNWLQIGSNRENLRKSHPYTRSDDSM